MTENKKTAGKPCPPNCIVRVEDDRTGVSVETLKRAIMDSLFYVQARFPNVATKNDYYLAVAYTVRDRLLQRWIHTARTYAEKGSRTVCYLSAEFLLGPHLGNNLINMGIFDQVRQAVTELGLDFHALMEQEEEPGLGNGGLGRLAACYLDSLATLEIPTIGYGIRYEYGIFDQEIRDGWQVEITDKWLRLGNPWEIARPEINFEVKLGGRTEGHIDPDGRYRVRWTPQRTVRGIAFDTPILGYQVNTSNMLRLWKSEAAECFDFQAFNIGDYFGAVQDKLFSENITKALYPNDESIQGKQLRLKQQYFFVSCSLQDMIRIHLQSARNLDNLHQKYAVQLNDTHPAIAIPELMRLLLDEHGYEWDQAWDITRKMFAYTNHTLLPEALEKWPIRLFGELLPRHLELIHEINHRFLEEVRGLKPRDPNLVSRVSIIDESGERYVRMAHLACIGSHSINGVAQLHSDLLKQDLLKDFHGLWPEKFNNKTNGVTPRRWMALANPRLTSLIGGRIGYGWIKQLDGLKNLEPLAEDPGFRKEWRAAKRIVKSELAEIILNRTGIAVNPDSMFDVQAKRIHEYKRQHLNALHIATLYQRIKRNPGLDVPPRTFLFGGKAAPGYYKAKLIIKLITSIGRVVNNDPDIGDRLKVVFLPDYNVKLAQKICPAADLSEQISTAGMEASGTGNMKFAMNGALTIGTLDGANIEIRDRVGHENFFLFGLTAEEVRQIKQEGYNPWGRYRDNPELRETIDRIAAGDYSPGNPELFKPIVNSLLFDDPYMLLADYPAYIDCQERVGRAYQNENEWTRKSILNTARMGHFSSDRSIQEYCRDIWKVKPVNIRIPDPE